MDQNGLRPGASGGAGPDRPSGTATSGILAFTFVVFLVTAALWPSPPSVAELAPPAESGHEHEEVEARPNIVGTVPYDGPLTAEGIVAVCQARNDTEGHDCYRDTLKAILVAKGAVAAFDALDRLAEADPSTSGQGHALAHDLGRLAYDAYGSIQVAVQNCSYKVFQGCFHGALQNHLDGVHDIDSEDLSALCPLGETARQSTCVHGIGHGLMLNTNANVNRSLGLCDGLPDQYRRGSCYSGVIMENLVGFQEGQQGHSHLHGNHTGPPGYMVEREGDPYFPCSVLAEAYLPDCWMQQADYILYLNGADFEDAAAKCDAAPTRFRELCRLRLGADSWGWYHDVPRTAIDCGYGNATFRPACIRGMVDAIVLYHFDPVPGITACRQVPATDKAGCYRQVPVQSSSMVSQQRMAEVCAMAEAEYVDDCRTGAGLHMA